MSEQQSSADKNTPAILAENTAGGDGIVGKGHRGVVGDGDGPCATLSPHTPSTYIAAAM